MKYLLQLLFFYSTIFGSIEITNSETGEKIPLYNKSWAVIIGIDDYKHVKPL